MRRARRQVIGLCREGAGRLMEGSGLIFRVGAERIAGAASVFAPLCSRVFLLALADVQGLTDANFNSPLDARLSLAVCRHHFLHMLQIVQKRLLLLLTTLKAFHGCLDRRFCSTTAQAVLLHNHLRVGHREECTSVWGGICVFQLRCSGAGRELRDELCGSLLFGADLALVSIAIAAHRFQVRAWALGVSRWAWAPLIETLLSHPGARTKS
mmetsp:Transcript_56902/g.133029  ORF Transcript_56902/g.133029 Transcript_56902/m.133029 type:complete len:211 (-) Transcript_56902:335-967(-)